MWMYFWCICGEEGDLHVLLFCHLEGLSLGFVFSKNRISQASPEEFNVLPGSCQGTSLGFQQLPLFWLLWTFKIKWTHQHVTEVCIFFSRCLKGQNPALLRTLPKLFLCLKGLRLGLFCGVCILLNSCVCVWLKKKSHNQDLTHSSSCFQTACRIPKEAFM